MNFKLLFGGLIALILLVLYVYAVLFAISIVNCVSPDNCTGRTPKDFNEGYELTMTTIGGIISALVIAVLATTTPGDPPGARLLTGAAQGQVTPKKVLTVLTGLYLLVWVFIGLAAFFYGVLQHPGTLQQLTDLGKAWLGLAGSAVFAYFGITPRGEG